MELHSVVRQKIRLPEYGAGSITSSRVGYPWSIGPCVHGGLSEAYATNHRVVYFQRSHGVLSDHCEPLGELSAKVSLRSSRKTVVIIFHVDGSPDDIQIIVLYNNEKSQYK